MTTEATLFQERITQDPAIMVGKPVIRGTRIPVDLVLEELAHNPDIGQLFAAHPTLNIEDVQACLAYGARLVRRQRARRRSVRKTSSPAA
jgi:uncharacterized protein (DUF433 family)